MKYRIIMLMLLAAAMLPTQGKEVGKLIPAAVLSVRLDEETNNVILQTDSENTGEGETTDAALLDLRAAAPGEVLLDTVEYVIAAEGDTAALLELKNILRPNVRVCKASEEVDLKEAWQYLRAHSPTVRMSEISENTVLQTLTWIEERFHLENGN